MSSKAEQILAGLGGAKNLVEIEACITRLRVKVLDPAAVDEGGLRTAGACGVVRSGHEVQVIVGAEADDLAAELDRLR